MAFNAQIRLPDGQEKQKIRVTFRFLTTPIVNAVINFKMTLEDLKANIKWWESKRWIFNILVGLSGLYGIYDFLQTIDYEWTAEDTIGIILWGIGANVFYSLGTLMELFDWYYFKNKIKITEGFRYLLLVGGIFFSCFWTFCNVVIYYKVSYY